MVVPIATTVSYASHVGRCPEADTLAAVNRHQFLAELHRLIQPRTYLEVGVASGASMALSRAPSIGIDPGYSLTAEIQADVQLARTTSDEFFARPRPLAHLPIPVIDLAFVDGMHLAEFALRDYLAIERFTTPASVVVFDDVLPRSVDEAARRRHTRGWTGDVYKALTALRRLRPDLLVVEVATKGSGVAVVLLPDSRRGGVLPGYDEWLNDALREDPQDVPPEVIGRSGAVDPQWLLSLGGWAQVPRLRRRRWGRRDRQRDAVRAAFADLVDEVSPSVAVSLS